MICVSIQNKTYEEILDIFENPDVELAEIRLDLCPALSDEEITDIFQNSETPLVATSRADVRKLKLAIEAGARYADLELEAPAEESRAVQKLCQKYGTELIRSYHNNTETPSDEELARTLARCFRYGADIVKIATKANSEEDVRRLESLYSVILEDVESMEGKLISFAIGQEWSASRVECLRRGAPFTYACLTEDETVAPGQKSLPEMRRLVYPKPVAYHRTGLRMPSSKSFSQRAIICAALSGGESRLEDYTPCGDSESAISAAEALGARVAREDMTDGRQTLVINGAGVKAGSIAPDRIDVGESGLLARIMIPVGAAAARGPFEVTGRGTLLRRPLAGAVNKMAAFGVMVHGGNIPVRVTGPLIPGTADVSGADGSQLISGLMMALPLCDKPSNVFVGEPKSIPYMYITQDVLRKFGIRMTTEMEGDAEMLELQDWSSCTGISFRIPAPQTYKPASFALESDWSAAAVYLVAGAIFGSCSIEGLDTGSLQADISILDILVDAGAVVSETSAEEADGVPVVSVRKAPLEAFEADLNNAPDLFPIVSVLAAFCVGESRISGLGRLSGKESDRAAAIIDILGGLGVEVETDGDTLLVRGELLSSRILGGRLLRGGRFSSRGDHRLVMALKVASLGAESPVVIDDEACVSKSYPDFSL